MFPRIVSNCHFPKIKGHRKSYLKRYSFLKSFQAFSTGNSAKRPCFGVGRPLIRAFSLSQNFPFSIQYLNPIALEFCLMPLLIKDTFTAKSPSITKFFIFSPPICKHPTFIQECCINANFQSRPGFTSSELFSLELNPFSQKPERIRKLNLFY